MSRSLWFISFSTFLTLVSTGCTDEPLYPLNTKTQAVADKDKTLVPPVNNICECIGTSGKDGNNGTNGIDGADGVDGSPGIDGLNGRDGRNGRDGVDGQNGSNGINGVGYNSLIRQSQTDRCLTVDSGIDSNINNVLDDDEVVSTNTICLPLISPIIVANSPYTNWNPGSPDNSGTRNEQCAFLSMLWKGTWDDRDCSIIGHAFCRRNDDTVFRAATAGYQWDSSTFCAQQNGIFSVPKNAGENAIVYSAVANKEFSWEDEITWLNITDMDLNGVWE